MVGNGRVVVVVAALSAGLLAAAGPVLAEPGRADPSLSADAALKPAPAIDGSSVAPLVSSGGAEPVRDVVAPGPSFSSPPPVTAGFVQGQSRLLKDASIPGRAVFSNPDGSTTVTVGASDAVPALDLTTASPAAGVALPVGSAVLRWRHPEAAASASRASTIDGSVKFADALPGGRDVVWSTAHGGFKETVIAADSAAPSSYEVDLDLPVGVSARDGSSGVDLLSEKGEDLGVVSGGTAFDSASPRAEVAVSVRLAGKGGATGTVHLVVAVDPAWWSDPARAWPVTVDPTCCTNSSSSTWVQSGLGPQVAPDQTSTTTMKVAGGSSPKRSLLRFGMTTLLVDGFGAPIDPATVAVNAASVSLSTTASNCAAGTIDVFGLSGGFDSTDKYRLVEWTNQPALDGNGLVGSISYTGSGCPAASVDVTSVVRRWIRGLEPNVGFGLRARNEGTTSGPWSFSGSAACYGCTGQPTLSVTFAGPTSFVLPSLPAPDDGATVLKATPILNVTRQASIITRARFKVATGLADAESGSVIADSGWLDFPAAPVNSEVSWAVPSGVLRDGQTYHWTAVAEAPSSVYPYPPVPYPQSWSRHFRVDLGVGAGPRPVDAAGPVTVNVASGNVSTGWSSPTFPTVVGPVGVSLVYNSLASTTAGLTGAYFEDAGGRRLGSAEARATRAWWDSTGRRSLPGGHRRGQGTCVGPTSPRVRATSSGDARVGPLVAQTYGTPVYGSSVTLTAGVPVAIKVEVWDNTGPAAVTLWAKGAVTETLVPGIWLSTADNLGVPAGWAFGTGLGISRVEPGDGTMTVVDSSGRRWTFVAAGTGFIPPVGSDSILAYDQSGQLVFYDGATTYAFDPGGQILSAQTAADDRHPAASTYTWSGTPARLRTIGDPVSTRQAQLSYGGDGACPTSPPSGLAAAPASMLCKIDWWDATSTVFWYTTGGQLARVVDPGGVTTDWAWTAGRLTAVRSPLAADAIAAGVRVDDATARTEIAYDAGGLPTAVTMPAATAGAALLQPCLRGDRRAIPDDEDHLAREPDGHGDALVEI